MSTGPDQGQAPQELSADTYRTRHIALAAYLKAKGFELIDTQQETKGPDITRTIFVFANGVEARAVAFGFRDSECGIYDREKQKLAQVVYGDKQRKSRKRE